MQFSISRISKIAIATIFSVVSIASASTIPKPALVAYWESWGTLKLTDLHPDINVVQLAFATTVGSSLYNMTFDNGPYPSDAAMEADIDLLHSQGKKVILSIGGAADPIFLSGTTEKTTFVTTMKAILARFNHKIDGIDIDIESTSFNFGSTWTASTPAAGGQQNLIDAIKEIMTYHAQQTGEHLILTMAPETVYIVGALSSYQMSNANGGAMIPIIEALRDSLDLMHAQLYNAYESVAVNGAIIKNDGDPDYITGITESIIKGFTLLNGKGVYNGLPASKVAIALPANSCDPYSSGWVTPAEVVQATKYLKGEITQPSGWSYNLTASYPDLAGWMTWSANEDKKNCVTEWEFANNFSNAFPEPTSSLKSQSLASLGVELNLQAKVLTLQSSETLDLNSRVTISNAMGKVVSDYSARELQEGVDLSALPAGSYFVKLNQFSAAQKVSLD